MHKFYLALSFLLFLPILAAAQDDKEHREHNEHDHHRHEIGIANSPVYYVGENAVSFGLHMHYLYNFPHRKIGLGVGFENIFDEHEHRTFGLVASYRPIDRLTFIASPGVTYEGSMDDYTFALHLETSYEYEFGNFHIGPVFEVAYDPEDIHISLGLHLGIGF
jgi:uncharacterized protein YhjY with autotransporter beta-barrel domain